MLFLRPQVPTNKRTNFLIVPPVKLSLFRKTNKLTGANFVETLSARNASPRRDHSQRLPSIRMVRESVEKFVSFAIASSWSDRCCSNPNQMLQRKTTPSVKLCNRSKLSVKRSDWCSSSVNANIGPSRLMRMVLKRKLQNKLEKTSRNTMNCRH